MEYLLVTDLRFKVESLEDLPTLKTIMDTNNLKPNFSELARELGVDPRTVKKYYEYLLVLLVKETIYIIAICIIKTIKNSCLFIFIINEVKW